MEQDPTAILKQKIEESKEGKLNAEAFKKIAAEQQEESDEESAKLPKGNGNDPIASLSESLTPVGEMKQKSYTPNPRKKPPASTTRSNPYILGASITFLSLINLCRSVEDQAVECQLLPKTLKPSWPAQASPLRGLLCLIFTSQSVVT